MCQANVWRFGTKLDGPRRVESGTPPPPPLARQGTLSADATLILAAVLAAGGDTHAEAPVCVTPARTSCCPPYDAHVPSGTPDAGGPVRRGRRTEWLVGQFEAEGFNWARMRSTSWLGNESAEKTANEVSSKRTPRTSLGE